MVDWIEDREGGKERRWTERERGRKKVDVSQQEKQHQQP